MQKTIAAISTPYAPGGIGIIRLSGEGAIEIANKIFKPKKGIKLKDKNTHTITFGEIFDPKTEEIVDECLASVMRAPNTYTGEDICELNCHGGLLLCNRVLALCMENGATLAEGGEFTKRAFLNGKMDLTKAEAVMDLISATNETALAIAATQIGGHMADKLHNLREELIFLCANILVEVEYPEDDPPPLEESISYITLCNILAEVDKIYASFGAGKAIKDGVSTAILGTPNVGKSSILNILAGYEKAIVTDIAGTTRDILEEKVSLGKVNLNLQDTAGIRETTDSVEKIGVERAKSLLEKCDLFYYVLDSSAPLSGTDIEMMELLDPKKTIIILNKTDLFGERPEIDDKFIHIVYFSAANRSGLDELKEITEEVVLGEFLNIKNMDIITNQRQKDCLLRAKTALESAKGGLDSGFTFDIVAIDLEDAIGHLGEITGQKASDDIITNIFSRFCLGK